VQAGKLKAVVEPGGARMIASYNSSGQMTQFAYETAETGVTGFEYTYYVGGSADQRISTVVLNVKSQAVRRAVYDYYGDESNGSPGDLKNAKI
jgi:hypothetical protein